MLEIGDIAKPGIAHDEVLVRVHAAGVDLGVWHLMAGLPYPVRLAGYGLRTPKNKVPGMDLAGVVKAVGRNVTCVHRPGPGTHEPPRPRARGADAERAVALGGGAAVLEP